MTATLPTNQKHDTESTTTRIECEYAEESDSVPETSAVSTAQDSHDQIQEQTHMASISFLSSSSPFSAPPLPPPAQLSFPSSTTPASTPSSFPMDIISPSSPMPPVVTDSHEALSQDHSILPELEIDLQEISFTMMDRSVVVASHEGSTESDPIVHAKDQQQPQQSSNYESQIPSPQQQEQPLHQSYHQHVQGSSTDRATYHPNPHQRPQPSYRHSQPPPQRQEHSLYPYPTVPKANQSMPTDASEMMHSNGPSSGSSNRRNQGNRRSWSPNDVLHSSPGGSVGYQHTHGYLTPPRQLSDGIPSNTSSSSNSRQSSVATSISLLTDAAILAKYRESANKTNDASTQISFAKYLLEIGESSSEFEASTRLLISTPPPSRPSSATGSTDRRPSCSLSDTGSNGSPPGPSASHAGHAGLQNHAATAITAGAAAPPPLKPLPSQSSPLLAESTEKAGKRQLTIEAMYWIDRLAKEGHPEAQFIKGSWYEDGLYLCKKSTDKAFRWYQSSSKGEYGPAHYKVGYYCEKRKDHNKAVMLYKKAATHNDVPASHRLAMIYFYGELGQQKNMKAGLQYLKRAAMLATESAPMAPYVLGLILAREYDHLNQTQQQRPSPKKNNKNKRPPLNIPDDIAFPDDSEALLWFRRSAELGYGPANYKLGYCHEYGALGCPIDPFLSVQHYERATWSPFKEHRRRYSMGAGEEDESSMAGDGSDSSYGGHGEAEMALSGWYLSGAEGYFPANDVLAFHYGSKAASKGLAKAQYAVGYYYEVGVSVPADMDKALEYYRLAAAQGNKDALDRLEQHKIEMEKTTEPEQGSKEQGAASLAVDKKKKKRQSTGKSKQGGDSDKQGCTIM
ncbi:uncharacterized protein EMPS_10450 [Entomortierella parvispora]|uniref:HCP-like protein n=1 Tax=Entomortierella parvispora TaxID=205924 RepID=A0A9P3HK38_9FUNG|nr:uncharacterized protein EMPS_10450 [Entomortierella parvispora]